MPFYSARDKAGNSVGCPFPTFWSCYLFWYFLCWMYRMGIPWHLAQAQLHLCRALLLLLLRQFRFSGILFQASSLMASTYHLILCLISFWAPMDFHSSLQLVTCICRQQQLLLGSSFLFHNSRQELMLETHLISVLHLAMVHMVLPLLVVSILLLLGPLGNLLVTRILQHLNWKIIMSTQQDHWFVFVPFAASLLYILFTCFSSRYIVLYWHMF